MRPNSKVIVVGGGPAGMMAASAAAASGADVTLIEKNEKLGKKLYITGKGRCNVTNAGATEDFFDRIAHNASFCYSAVYAFPPARTREVIEANGTPLKVERGQRVFPVSDRASDITKALERNMKGVQVKLNTRLEEIYTAEGRLTGIRAGGHVQSCDALILALGGASYASTGSDGAWKTMLEKLGHTVEPFTPALVPLSSKETWVRSLQGISLRNVTLCAKYRGRVIREEMGEMLFTHTGVSGPLILTLSSCLRNTDFSLLRLTLDLKPALSEAVLEERILREVKAAGAKTVRSACNSLLPSRLLDAVLQLAGIEPGKPAAQFSQGERRKLVSFLKALPLPVDGFEALNEAIVTRGGVNVKEIDPSTMESKRVSGLFFAGEMIDIDAFTGGYNIQLALSTGFLAGSSCRKEDFS